MLMFNDLKQIISKCCFVDKNVKSFTEKFGFTVDCEKLEKELQKRDSHLHVMSFYKKINSSDILLSDLQMLIDYVRRDKDLEMILDGVDSGDCQMVNFILWYDQEASIEYNQKLLEYNDIFYILNDENNPTDETDNIAKMIVKEFPMYSVFMTKVFNNVKEKFEYKIYFRSNNSMMEYIKDAKNKDTVDTDSQE